MLTNRQIDRELLNVEPCRLELLSELPWKLVVALDLADASRCIRDVVEPTYQTCRWDDWEQTGCVKPEVL